MEQWLTISADSVSTIYVILSVVRYIAKIGKVEGHYGGEDKNPQILKM